MNRDILTVIQGNMHTFSKGQKRIANYILNSYDKAAFMTASRLGKKVSVSESTVVRFATEIGYEGYPELQKAMQETRAASQWESEKLLKEFQSQAGKISESYSSRLSRAEDTLRESARSIGWKMYAPTIILVLWELVRHLWLRG